MSTSLSTLPFTRPSTRLATRYKAPARFDTHAVATFEAWLAEHVGSHRRLIVDLSEVVFIDLFAVEALEAAQTQAAASHGRLSLESLSVAALITFEMLAARPTELAKAA